MIRVSTFMILLFALIYLSSNQVLSQLSYKDEAELNDSTKTPEIYSFRFNKIIRDTISLEINDILVCDSFCAQGIPYTYDALHSFNARRMDRFGGYLNVKINKGLEEIRNKGFPSDIKKLHIQINPVTLKVYWFAVLGPSTDGKSYVRVDSRGSAGGGLPAVTKQLPRMHRNYDGLSAHKFLEFNENVKVYYDWNGNQLCDFKGAVNIRQHFYKYGTYDVSKIETVVVDSSQTSANKIVAPEIITTQQKIQVKTVTKPRYKTYKVKSGDTLSEIAAKYHVSISHLKKTNNLRSNTIQIGQILKIPN